MYIHTRDTPYFICVKLRSWKQMTIRRWLENQAPAEKTYVALK